MRSGWEVVEGLKSSNAVKGCIMCGSLGGLQSVERCGGAKHVVVGMRQDSSSEGMRKSAMHTTRIVIRRLLRTCTTSKSNETGTRSSLTKYRL
jgi:hypothetical protein